MLSFLSKLFNEHERKLNDYRKLVSQINDLEPGTRKLTDAKLRSKTAEFKSTIQKSLSDGKSEEDILNMLLPEAFAVVREASRRVLGLRHFDVQLLAGIALHKGVVTEQKTGEGKTLTVTLPLYLNSLLGKGSHLVTVNDYLAEVGIGWMGPIYDFLGLKSAVIVHDRAKLYDPTATSEERGDERLEHFLDVPRQEAYAADITYGTNNEFGFDYLRDNMVQSISDMVQRPVSAHHYAIVDEADSILIDEARTPLIISAPDTQPTKKYYDFAKLVQALTKDTDFKLDEKLKTVTLTDLGVKRVEQKLGVTNLYEESFDIIHLVEASLKAKTLYQRDKEYIVRDNQVVIVDEHTGRLMYGRRYSDGLHQAIEAKENVTIQQESRTLATISLQNYFRMYHKLSGMSGTAVTESEEFRKIYNMDVLPIPTNVTAVRQDMSDVVYKTTAAKYSALVREIESRHKSGQPILVGTRSIDHNQVISSFLSRKNIPHQVLNAKNNEREAFIIADAGKKDASTVATNIAGRGVDIVLGGAKPELKDFRKKTTSKLKVASPVPKELARLVPPSTNPANYDLAGYAKSLSKWQVAHDAVTATGGLHIIGSERHESRRIDNQLRGRSGRQGDPGSTQFFLSLEDEIMRLFGGAQISKLMDFLKIEEDQPIEHGMVGKAIESAQVKVEGFFFDQRKRLVEFDDVMNKQREVIYRRRRRILQASEGKPDSKSAADSSLKSQIMMAIESEVASMVALRAPQSFTADEYDAIIKEFVKIIPFNDASQHDLRGVISGTTKPEEIETKLVDIVHSTYKTREEVVGSAHMRNIERLCMLSTIDEKWMDHLDEMDNLREGIWMRGDKQAVLSEYKKEGFAMFENLITSIDSTIASRIFRIHIQDEPNIIVQPRETIEQRPEQFTSLTQEVSQSEAETSSRPTNIQGGASDLARALSSASSKKAPQPGVSVPKVGRNDPCPCGSGKKYKKCHGAK